MSARNVANALWSFLALAATRGAPLPRCYGALWRAAGELDTRDARRQLVQLSTRT